MQPSRVQQVLALIRDDPMISQQAIAKKLGISRSAVAGHIMKLSSKGIIKGRGYVFSEAPFVAVIGGTNMDIHGKATGVLRRHDSNPGMVHMSPGGVARNIAENLARLGADCRLVSAVGNDQHGQFLMRQCRDAGIDTQHVKVVDSAPTSTYLSILDRSGDMRVAINDMAIIQELRPEQLREQETMLKQASLIILDTNLHDDTLAWLLSTFARQTIFVDAVSTVKAKKLKRYLKAIHTLKTSQIEAEALSGLSARRQTDRRKIAAWFHAQGVAQLFITLGKAGVFYSTGDAQGVLKLKRDKRTMRNASGAGDAFMSAIAYAWLKDWSLMKSVRFALVAAELTLADSASSSPTLSLASINRAYRSHHAG